MLKSQACLCCVVLLLVVRLVFSRECEYIIIRGPTCGRRHDGTECGHQGAIVFVKSMVGHREEARTAKDRERARLSEIKFAERPTAADPSEVVTLVALVTARGSVK